MQSAPVLPTGGLSERLATVRLSATVSFWECCGASSSKSGIRLCDFPAPAKRATFFQCMETNWLDLFMKHALGETAPEFKSSTTLEASTVPTR